MINKFSEETAKDNPALQAFNTWYDANHEKYEGQWVAFKGHQFIGYSKFLLTELFEELEKNGIDSYADDIFVGKF